MKMMDINLSSFQIRNKSYRLIDRRINTTTFRSYRLLAFAAASVLAAGGGWAGANLHAATQTWAPGGVDGSGNWDTSTADWNPGQVDWVNNNGAVFGLGGSTSETVTIDTTGITASGLTFNAMSSGAYYTIAGTSTDNLTLSNGGSTGTVNVSLNTNATITAPVVFGSNFLLTSIGNHTLTFSGSSSVTFNNSGENVTLGNGNMANAPTIDAISHGSGSGGFKPNFIMDGGTFQSYDIGHSGQSLTSEGGTGIINTFDANNNLTSGVESSITQTVAGTTFVLQDGVINLVVDNSTFTAGTLQIGSPTSANGTDVVFGYQVSSANNNNLPAGNVTINLDGGTLTQASANVTINSTTYTVDTSPNTISNPITLTGANTISSGSAPNMPLVLGGAITGTGSVALNGVTYSSVVLEGNNTYTGGTTINGGAGAVAGSDTAFGASSGDITIGSNGNSRIAYGATNLTIANNLALASGSNDTLDMHGNSTEAWSGIISGSGGLTIVDSKNAGGQLTLSNTNTYTGGTTVGDNTNNVALNLTGSLANSNITILSHASMTGSGTLNWSVNGDTVPYSINAQGGLNITGLHLDVTATGTQTQSQYLIADYNSGSTFTLGTTFANVLYNGGTLPTGWSINYGTDITNEILLVGPVTVSTLTWDPTGAGTDGSGTWDTSTANWNSPGVVWTNTDIAAIGNGGAGGTINIDGPVTVAGLTFNTVTSPYTITASGTGALTLANAAGVTIKMNADATISAPINADNNLLISGNKTLTLTGGVTFVSSGGVTPGITIGTGSTSAVPILIAAGGGGTGPASVTFDSGTFEFTTSGQGFDQPVISTDNGTAVTNTFDAGGAGNTQDIQSTIAQSRADTFVLQDGGIYLTASNAGTFTAGTLQFGNGTATTNILFGYQVSSANNNNLPASGVTIAMDDATLTQASAAGPNSEAVDTAANTISNAMTLTGANTINTGTLYNLTLAGNITGTGSLTVNGDGVSTRNVILLGPATYTGATSIQSDSLTIGAGGSINGTSALIIAAGAKLNLTNTAAGNSVVIDYGTNPSPNSTIQSDLANGAITAPTGYAVGYADGADGVVSGLSAGQEKLMVTLPGDATLSGRVGLAAYGIILSNFGMQSGAQWDQGDFTYNGKVNLADYGYVLANFGQSLSAPLVRTMPAADVPAQGDHVVIPEPATLVLLTLGGMGLIIRQKYKACA